MWTTQRPQRLSILTRSDRTHRRQRQQKHQAKQTKLEFERIDKMALAAPMPSPPRVSQTVDGPGRWRCFWAQGRMTQMEFFDEAVIVAVPITRVCEGWTEFKYFPDFMSGPEPSLPDVVHRSSLDEMWPEFDAAIGGEVPHRIAWLSLDGPSRTGVVVFSPLDAGNTRVSVRFEWELKQHAPLIDRAEVLVALSAFKDFMESPPVNP